MRHVKTIILVVAMSAAVLLILAGNVVNKQATDKNRAIGLQNNTYNRIMVCIASVTPTERTPAYVKQCYDEAERHNQVEVTRFGHGK